MLTAPELEPVSAVFKTRRSLDVYSAPNDASYRNANAQVTTNDSVIVYGVVDNWVLVSYPIGYNNIKGRIGYIQNITLSEPESVHQLQFADVKIELKRSASATDDPIYGQKALFRISKGDTITLLAFMGDEWAYVETDYLGQQCRVFIPRAAVTD